MAGIRLELSGAGTAAVTGAEQRALLIVGCGRIVELAHVPALAGLPGVRVTGLVDPAENRTKTVGDLLEAGSVRRYSATAEVDPNGAVVVSAAPPIHRANHVAWALREGAAAVLAEKPLAESARAASDLVRTARSYGVPLLPVHNYRREGDILLLTELVRSGRLGPVYQVEIQHHMSGAFPGAWPGHEQWRSKDAAGCLSDLMYHALYLVEDLAGQPVTGRCHATPRTGPFTCARAELCTAWGASADIDVSWQAPGHAYVLRVSGKHGVAEVRRDGSVKVRRNDGPNRTYRTTTGLPDAYRRIYQDLLASLDDPADYAEAEEGVAVSRALETLAESARLGGRNVVLTAMEEV